MSASPTSPSLTRNPNWKWAVCGLLLLASAINYMDRQTLANASIRITEQFHLKQERYGDLEVGFGWAFAVGSVVFGVLADKIPLRIFYPIVLTLWSVVGFATGFVHDFRGLLICRTLLGFFEAGHWPCSVKTIQRLLEPKERSMGNSILQSGTSIGAVLTPVLMSYLLTSRLDSWRFAFQIVGALGVVWVFFWFALIRKGDLDARPISLEGNPAPDRSIWEVIFSRKMLIVLIMVASINTWWQLLRAWLPKLLVEGRHYPETQMLYFNALFYIFTDVGCLGAGALTLLLQRQGIGVINARKLTFFLCALLSALTLVIAWLPHSPILLMGLLIVGAGSLGVFPIYHAFTQDLSRHHQGKITGLAGVAAWAFSFAQKYYGRSIDRTGSFDLGLALGGCLPLIAFIALLFWEQKKTRPPFATTNPP